MRQFNMAVLTALTCASLSLGGCEAVSSGLDTAKSFVYAKGAKALNDYCVVRDEQIVNDMKSRINTGLRAAGARGELDPKVTCDP